VLTTGKGATITMEGSTITIAAALIHMVSTNGTEVASTGGDVYIHGGPWVKINPAPAPPPAPPRRPTSRGHPVRLADLRTHDDLPRQRVHVVLARGLKDKTIHILSLTDQGPSGMSVVVTRERVEPTDTLDAYALRQFKILRQQLPMFRMAEATKLEVDKQPARQVDFFFQARGLDVQRQTTVFVPGPTSR